PSRTRSRQPASRPRRASARWPSTCRPGTPRSWSATAEPARSSSARPTCRNGRRTGRATTPSSAPRTIRGTSRERRAGRAAARRIGLVLDDPGCPVSPEVGAVVRQAVDALRKSGAQLEEGWPPGVVPADQYDAYLYALFATFGFQLKDEQFESLRARAASKD